MLPSQRLAEDFAELMASRHAWLAVAIALQPTTAYPSQDLGGIIPPAIAELSLLQGGGKRVSDRFNLMLQRQE